MTSHFPRLGRPGRALALAVAGALTTVSLSACASADEPGADGRAVLESSQSGTASGQASDAVVLAISVDGLNPTALRRLGREGAPNFWRLRRHGAWTWNARTSYEKTITLPNHTGMVTSRRVNRKKGGHGVTWNTDRPGTTVQAAAGHRVESIFSLTQDAGVPAGLFGGKSKFSLFDRSWKGIDRVLLDPRSGMVKNQVERWITRGKGARFGFWHIGLPDGAGHAHGWLSPQYLDAVRRTDRQIGHVLDAISADRALKKRLTVVLTADHGGNPGTVHHEDASLLADYRIPFMVWGAGVGNGDLYALNDTYQDPGTSRPGMKRPKQPIRNADLGNLSADLLGLDAIPDSQMDAEQQLAVR